MKTIFKKINFILLFASVLFFTACTTVDSGHKGVEVSWGGETNMNQVYPEGMNSGLHWIWDHMEEYDVRDKTVVQKFAFNDKNSMLVPVEFSVDYNLAPDKVNIIHSKVGKDQLEVKIHTTLSSAAKQVIPQYSASELNLTKREEAEQKVLAILKTEYPEFYCEAKTVRITDVDIPGAIAETAEANAKQNELNKLAESKKTEAENNYHSAEWNAKTKAILSQPAMLELQRVENERLMWEGFKAHGNSPFGNNNTFGVSPTVIKGLK